MLRIILIVILFYSSALSLAIGVGIGAYHPVGGKNVDRGLYSRVGS
jgi:hypothetical protein